MSSLRYSPAVLRPERLTEISEMIKFSTLIIQTTKLKVGRSR